MFAHLNDLPVVEKDMFQQILSLDDDQDNYEFTKQLVDQFFDQAQQTISQIELLMYAFLLIFRKQGNLAEISKQGHFLKGSSAALGLARIRSACEAIQHYGLGKDPYNSMSPISVEVAITNVTHLTVILKELNDISKQAFIELFDSLKYRMK